MTKTENSVCCILTLPSSSGHLIAGFVWPFVATHRKGLKKSILMNRAKLANYQNFKSSCYLHVTSFSGQCFYWRRKQRDCFQWGNAWISLQVYYFKKLCRLNDASQEVFSELHFFPKAVKLVSIAKKQLASENEVFENNKMFL